MVSFKAIYIMWLRDMKKYLRARSRIIGSLIIPLLFLVFLGLGFNNMIGGVMPGIDYTNFLVPGIIGMSMIFSSMFAGISVLWDREFGFLKEIMVAPVDRVSIILGRIAGGATTAIIQGILVLVIAIAIGFITTSIFSVLLSILFMLFIAFTFIGFGLILASKIRDMQGFGMIMNMVIFPLFFLSGALFPIDGLPSWITAISYADPLTYGVDGLRGALIGASTFPLLIDIAVLIGFSIVMVALGSYLFDKSDAV